MTLTRQEPQRVRVRNKCEAVMGQTFWAERPWRAEDRPWRSAQRREQALSTVSVQLKSKGGRATALPAGGKRDGSE